MMKPIVAQALTLMTAVENNYTPLPTTQSHTAIIIILYEITTVSVNKAALTHGKKGDPKQRRVKFPIRDEKNPSCRHVGDADGEDAQQAQEGFPAQAVPHRAGDGGCQEHQHQADQYLAFGQYSCLVEVPP